MKKKVIVGIGNPLRCDDGIGIILIEYLRKNSEHIPSDIDIVDGGTGGMKLLHTLEKYEKILIVDAVDFQEKPGVTKFFNIDYVKSNKKDKSLSIHEDDFFKIVNLLKKLDDKSRDIFVFGIQPKDTSFKEKLSKILNDKKEEIYKKLENEIKNFFR